jgi:S-adenosylmethionine synthetase
VVLLGEVSLFDGEVNFEQIARKVCKEVGFTSDDVGLDCNSCNVIVNVEEQSHEIALAVHKSVSKEDMGAGDQGLMFGYATDEWDKESLHPLSHYLANKITEEMGIARHSGAIPWLRPDCKSQVIVEYKKEGVQIKPVSVYNILISTQHDAVVTN